MATAPVSWPQHPYHGHSTRIMATAPVSWPRHTTAAARFYQFPPKKTTHKKTKQKNKTKNTKKIQKNKQKQTTKNKQICGRTGVLSRTDGYVTAFCCGHYKISVIKIQSQKCEIYWKMDYFGDEMAMRKSAISKKYHLMCYNTGWRRGPVSTQRLPAVLARPFTDNTHVIAVS